jgi:hypothetical protein
MPIRLFADGERPSASDLNRFFMQQVHALKTASESVTSSTTAQDDDHLFVPVDANTTYWVTAVIYYTAHTSGDLKLGWYAPSGTTFDWVSDAFSSTSTAAGVDAVSRSHQMLTSLPGPGGNIDGVPISIAAVPRGVLMVGGTPGMFGCRWAQLASHATATTVRAESILILRRLTD